jgi:hypothetical protein
VKFTQISNAVDGTAVADPYFTGYSVSGGFKIGAVASAYQMTVTVTNPPASFLDWHVTATASADIGYITETGTYYSYPCLVTAHSPTGFDILLFSGSGTVFPTYAMDIYIDFTASAIA